MFVRNGGTRFPFDGGTSRGGREAAAWSRWGGRGETGFDVTPKKPGSGRRVRNNNITPHARRIHERAAAPQHNNTPTAATALMMMMMMMMTDDTRVRRRLLCMTR